MSDGYVVRGRYWPATATPRIGYLYFHGIQSHGGWYEGSASQIASTGQPVLMVDRRGSGLNAAARGDTPSAERWLADIDELTEWLIRETRVSCLGLIGVSWGGKLAVGWTAQGRAPVPRSRLVLRDFVQGVLLIAPGIWNQIRVPWHTRLRIGSSALAFPTRRFAIPLGDPALFTGAPDGQAFIVADDQKLTAATARFYYHSTRLDRALRRLPPGALNPRTTLWLASQDAIVQNERTKTWLAGISRKPPNVQLLEAVHTLEFDLNRDTYAEMFAGWTRSMDEL